MHTRVAATICQELERNGWKYIELARAAGITHGALSQIVSKGFRLAPATLEKLSHKWPSQISNNRVLVAHLLDEIERAGHAAHHWKIEHRDHKHGTDFSANLDFIRRASEHVPALVDLIGQLCAITRAELPAELLNEEQPTRESDSAENGEKVKKLIATERPASYHNSKDKNEPHTRKT